MDCFRLTKLDVLKSVTPRDHVVQKNLNYPALFNNQGMWTSPPLNQKPNQPDSTSIQAQVVEFFVDGVRVIGLPRSLGEIYGLALHIADALSLDDLVRQLGISKGSASQGLRT